MFDINFFLKINYDKTNFKFKKIFFNLNKIKKEINIL